jgi:hypothetical protein
MMPHLRPGCCNVLLLCWAAFVPYFDAKHTLRAGQFGSDDV